MIDPQLKDGIRAIIFDWDGTLMDSTALIVHAIQQASVDLSLPMPDRSIASYVIGLGLEEALRHATPDLPTEHYAQMVERYRHHYDDAAETLVVFDRAHHVIGELRGAGYFVTVATGKSRSGLQRALTQTGLLNAFDFTRCADETFSKPHPAMVLETCEFLGINPNAALVVGDTTHDLLMASNAGAHAVGLTCGAHPRELLLEHRPLTLCADVGDFARWFAVTNASSAG
jgi:phosphoglycolate phosphatase